METFHPHSNTDFSTPKSQKKMREETTRLKYELRRSVHAGASDYIYIWMLTFSDHMPEINLKKTEIMTLISHKKSNYANVTILMTWTLTKLTKFDLFTLQ